MPSLLNYLRLVESEQVSPGLPDTDPQDLAIYRDIWTRVDQDSFAEWAGNNNWSEDDLSTEDLKLHALEYYLSDEFSIRVGNGAIHFYTLDQDAARLIGNNPVTLYHFTSSARAKSIQRDGLISGKRSVNGRIADGVYLTTETDGPAIRGYLHNAVRGSRTAHGVRLTIRTTLDDLEPDEDDAGITSGAHQFVTDYVAPAQIVAIDRA